MNAAQWINKLLGPFNVAITRQNSLESLRSACQHMEAELVHTRGQIQETAALRALVAEEMAGLRAETSALRSQVGSLSEQVHASALQKLEYDMFARWQLLDRLETCFPYAQRALCPLCGEPLPNGLREYRTECIFQGGLLVRHQCPHCDVIFGPEKMFQLSPSALAEEYKWHYTFCNESNTQDREYRTFFGLEPKKDGVYLNYGAGKWAHTRQRLRDEGWDVYDYDPFAPVPGEHVITSRSELATRRFDGIFSHDLMEHLPDPIAELKFMASLLNPGGLMNHATGCWEYMYEYTRFHFFFFTGRSKDVLAERANLQLKKFECDLQNVQSPYYSCLFEANATGDAASHE